MPKRRSDKPEGCRYGLAAGAGKMLEDGLNPVPDIPFEVVDDEEMAAIESAFLHAQSLASAYSSMKHAQVLFASNLGHYPLSTSCSVNGNSNITTASSLSAEGKPTGPIAASVNSFHVFRDNISASGTSLDAESLSSQGDTGESQTGTQSTLTVASTEVSAGVTDEEGTLVWSTDPVDIMMVGSQNAAPATKAFEFEHEWCEKQVEFSMTRGKPQSTPAMKAGSERHLQLEVEVVTRVEIEIHTKEDAWATRLLNFISGSRQLLSEGITRELPVLGLLTGTWIVGIIDEIHLVEKDGMEYPLLVDTKTRRRKVPPAEPQKRNARLQLMSYKYLWDSMVETGLPFEAFFKHFGLRPHQKLCSDVRLHASSFYQECEIKCLQDLLPQITSEIVNYPLSLDTLLLRYEWQADQSLLGQDEFLYEHDWLMGRWQWHLEFWKGRRQAYTVPEDETWKCRHCSFASVCKPVKDSADENVTTQKI